MKLYVYSTLSSDVRYQNTEAGGADLPRVVADVLVRGGAGVANDRFVTPRGVATEITPQQAEALRKNPVFQLHEKNGYVQIAENYIDPEKAAADMEGRDVSAPIVPDDLAPDDRPAGSEEKPPAAPASGKPGRRGKR